MAFDAHGFVDEDAEAFGEAVVALLSQKLQDVAQEFRIGVVGHVMFRVGCVCDTPTGNQCGPPSTSFSRAERFHPVFTPPGFGCARLATLAITHPGPLLHSAEERERNGGGAKLRPA